MKLTHLLSSDHGDDGDTLLPHHLPEVLTRVRQRTLCGNVGPLLSTYCYLVRQDTKTVTGSSSVLESWISRKWKQSVPNRVFVLCQGQRSECD